MPSHEAHAIVAGWLKPQAAGLGKRGVDRPDRAPRGAVVKPCVVALAGARGGIRGTNYGRLV